MSNDSAPLRVLIVDDEPLLCWALAQTLTAAGDVVVEADSAKAAIHALTTAPQPMDVVLLIISFPIQETWGCSRRSGGLRHGVR